MQCASWLITGCWLEQDAESFLSEVIIMRQDVCDTLLPHGIHRNAVSQAIAFIPAGFVEKHACQEGIARLRIYRHVRVTVKITDKVNRLLSEHATGFGKCVENLGQHFIGCNQMASCKGLADGYERPDAIGLCDE